ncbi:MAG: HEAT repeat domain-containing protein, partial [Deltaproteobacteria bacterium]|nr:HEAT repeat domain-containing protein [Deltaproteobacteria bacterium]
MLGKGVGRAVGMAGVGGMGGGGTDAILELLGRMRAPGAVEIISHFVRDPSLSNRNAAVAALGAIGTDGAVRILSRYVRPEYPVDFFRTVKALATSRNPHAVSILAGQVRWSGPMGIAAISSLGLLLRDRGKRLAGPSAVRRQAVTKGRRLLEAVALRAGDARAEAAARALALMRDPAALSRSLETLKKQYRPKAGKGRGGGAVFASASVGRGQGKDKVVGRGADQAGGVGGKKGKATAKERRHRRFVEEQLGACLALDGFASRGDVGTALLALLRKGSDPRVSACAAWALRDAGARARGLLLHAALHSDVVMVSWNASAALVRSHAPISMLLQLTRALDPVVAANGFVGLAFRLARLAQGPRGWRNVWTMADPSFGAGWARSVLTDLKIRALDAAWPVRASLLRSLIRILGRRSAWWLYDTLPTDPVHDSAPSRVNLTEWSWLRSLALGRIRCNPWNDFLSLQLLRPGRKPDPGRSVRVVTPSGLIVWTFSDRSGLVALTDLEPGLADVDIVPRPKRRSIIQK